MCAGQRRVHQLFCCPLVGFRGPAYHLLLRSALWLSFHTVSSISATASVSSAARFSDLLQRNPQRVEGCDGVMTVSSAVGQAKHYDHKGGGIEHLSMVSISSLPSIKLLGKGLDLGACATLVKMGLRDRGGDEDQDQRFARRAAAEEGDASTHQRWPRFQSSIRAWIVTAMPISATAMNTQRSVSR